MKLPVPPSDEATVSGSPQPTTPGKDPFRAAPRVYVRTWHGLVDSLRPMLRLLTRTEAHVYAFSIAANVLLSLFPFLLTMVLLCRWVFHWEGGVRAILFAVTRCFPDYHNGGYLDIAGALNETAWKHRQGSILSILMLFFTANGIFQPLEFALNRAWRVKHDRSYVHSQLVSLGLIFLCGALFLVCTIFLGHGLNLNHSRQPAGATIFFKLITLPLFVLIMFAAYWILPNRKIPATRLIPASVIVGTLLSALNYVGLVTWPWLLIRLRNEVGPFVHSVSIVLWSFAGSLIVLAGAEWSARVTVSDEILGD